MVENILHEINEVPQFGILRISPFSIFPLCANLYQTINIIDEYT